MKRLLLVAILSTGCSLNTRPVGTKDPAVEIARSNAEAEKARSDAQIAMMRALVEALARLNAAPAKAGVCLGPDGVTVIDCAVLR